MMRKLLALLTLFCATACGDVSIAEGEAKAVQRLRLPDDLREVSGLAAVGHNELLTVTDELATVYTVNLETGGVKVLFSLGDPVIRADFEGITISGRDVWLVTSRGVLYRAIDGMTGGHNTQQFEVFSTGLEERCEVEGLTFDSTRFLLACKENFRKKERDQLRLYAWSPGDGQTSVYLARPFNQLGSIRKLSPSGLSLAGDRIHIVAARQHLLLTIDREGNLLNVRTLHGHPQAEGIAVMPDGSIAIADEGGKKGGVISLYAPVIGSD